MATPILPIDESAVQDLPPSAKLIILVLERSGPMTRQELIDGLGLSSSTVHEALLRLEGADLVERQPGVHVSPQYRTR